MILSGTELAREITTLIKTTLEQNNIRPTLAVIQVGNDSASTIYVERKRAVARDVGIETRFSSFEDTTTTDALITEIEALNEDPTVHAILVQLPLPPHIDTQRVMESIRPTKDVDGFHPENIFAYTTGKSVHTPVLIQAIEWLLGKTEQSFSGKHAVIVGKSDIFLEPLSFMLARYGMSVTWTKPPHIEEEKIASADVLIVAVGIPELITASMIRPGATVIDIGINRTPDGRVCGDVASQGITEKAGWITPTPGGVGPVTIAALMWNTVRLALESIDFTTSD